MNVGIAESEKNRHRLESPLGVWKNPVYKKPPKHLCLLNKLLETVDSRWFNQ